MKIRMLHKFQILRPSLLFTYYVKSTSLLFLFMAKNHRTRKCSPPCCSCFVSTERTFRGFRNVWTWSSTFSAPSTPSFPQYVFAQAVCQLQCLSCVYFHTPVSRCICFRSSSWISSQPTKLNPLPGSLGSTAYFRTWLYSQVTL